MVFSLCFGFKCCPLYYKENFSPGLLKNAFEITFVPRFEPPDGEVRNTYNASELPPSLTINPLQYTFIIQAIVCNRIKERSTYESLRGHFFSLRIFFNLFSRWRLPNILAHFSVPLAFSFSPLLSVLKTQSFF